MNWNNWPSPSSIQLYSAPGDSYQQQYIPQQCMPTPPQQQQQHQSPPLQQQQHQSPPLQQQQQHQSLPPQHMTPQQSHHILPMTPHHMPSMTPQQITPQQLTQPMTPRQIHSMQNTPQYTTLQTINYQPFIDNTEIDLTSLLNITDNDCQATTEKQEEDYDYLLDMIGHVKTYINKIECLIQKKRNNIHLDNQLGEFLVPKKPRYDETVKDVAIDDDLDLEEGLGKSSDEESDDEDDNDDNEIKKRKKITPGEKKKVSKEYFNDDQPCTVVTNYTQEPKNSVPRKVVELKEVEVVYELPKNNIYQITRPTKLSFKVMKKLFQKYKYNSKTSLQCIFLAYKDSIINYTKDKSHTNDLQINNMLDTLKILSSLFIVDMAALRNLRHNFIRVVSLALLLYSRNKYIFPFKYGLGETLKVDLKGNIDVVNIKIMKDFRKYVPIPPPPKNGNTVSKHMCKNLIFTTEDPSNIENFFTIINAACIYTTSRPSRTSNRTERQRFHNYASQLMLDTTCETMIKESDELDYTKKKTTMFANWHLFTNITPNNIQHPSDNDIITNFNLLSNTKNNKSMCYLIHANNDSTKGNSSSVFRLGPSKYFASLKHKENFDFNKYIEDPTAAVIIFGIKQNVLMEFPHPDFINNEIKAENIEFPVTIDPNIFNNDESFKHKQDKSSNNNEHFKHNKNCLILLKSSDNNNFYAAIMDIKLFFHTPFYSRRFFYFGKIINNTTYYLDNFQKSCKIHKIVNLMKK
ncbi:MAL7P1.132-like protein [Glossina pallidipes salivary gland hypertrophy virus]|uniref:MAL7P1.132-like protein n=1 Tax=Glossina hytrovirus (isolate Glossina pallidipes/Ethiopia/Seibersdorf/-) TaxID=379529 RepID=A0A120HYB1_GHVS|nr:MAL7P1.132-like protein [Glossina pallidipes salivary gland hypertrophy virus]